MAHKKQGGKLVQHTRPQPKYLGVKVSDGEKVGPGMVLIRQVGTRFKAGPGTKIGRDHTLYSIAEGVVKFGIRMGKKQVSVV